MKIAYTGTSDFQEFGKADFDKAGVEGGKKLRFARNEPIEVDDAIGEALTSNEGIFGDFSFEQVEEDEDADPEPKSAAAKAKAGSGTGAGATTEGTADSDGASGPTSTGKGTSTSGRTR